jgi:hypothetical protein
MVCLLCASTDEVSHESKLLSRLGLMLLESSEAGRCRSSDRVDRSRVFDVIGRMACGNEEPMDEIVSTIELPLLDGDFLESMELTPRLPIRVGVVST